MEYAVMVVLDLDVKVLDSTKAEEVEKITENLIRIHLEGLVGSVGKIKMLRAKLLGLSKDMP